MNALFYLLAAITIGGGLASVLLKHHGSLRRAGVAVFAA